MIVATGDRSLVESLAVRADVARVDSNRPSRWIEDPEVANFEVDTGKPECSECRRMGREECECAGGLGDGLYRSGHGYWQPGYRHALEPQRAQTQVSRLEWGHGQSQL